MDADRFYIDRKLDSLKRLVLLYGDTPEGSVFLMQKYVEVLCSSIDSLRELLVDFNDLHEMHRQKTRLHFTTFDLMEFLQTVADLLCKDAYPEEVVITLPNSGSVVEVTADRVRFQKAVYYFLSGILLPSSEGSSAMIGIDKETHLLHIVATAPAQPEDKPIGEGRYTEKLIRFYTATELIKYQGGHLLLRALSPYSNEYSLSLPLHPNKI